MGLFRYRTESGELRRWSFTDILKGKPFGHPSHPMFVHFPVAFYLAVVVFDIMSRLTPTPGLVLAGTYLLIGAVLATAAAALTGLLDWAGMVKGSSKRRLATRHMLLQIVAAGFFGANLVLRWSQRLEHEAETLWIVLGVTGYLILAIGQWLGGILVYQKGMRVSTGPPAE